MQAKYLPQIFVKPVQYRLIAEQQSCALICECISSLKEGDALRVSEVNKDDGSPTGAFVNRVVTLVTNAKKPTFNTGQKFRYVLRLEKLG